MERTHARVPRRRGARRRARRAAGRPLVRRRHRLLLDLRARQPDRRAAVGARPGRPARPRRAARRRRRPTALRDWLGEHVHRHGRKYPPRELVARVVGGPISVQPFVDYLTAKLSADLRALRLAPPALTGARFAARTARSAVVERRLGRGREWVPERPRSPPALLVALSASAVRRPLVTPDPPSSSPSPESGAVRCREVS